MFQGISKGALAVVGAIIGLAILAVIVGRQSTASVITQATGGLSQLVKAAVTLNVTAGATNAAQGQLQTPAITSSTALLPGLSGG